MEEQKFIELVEILKMKKELLNNILNITKNIKAMLINNTIIEVLNAEIQNRQEIIIEIDGLDSALFKIKQQIPDEDFSKQLEAVDIQKTIKNILSNVIQVDRENYNIMDKKLKDYSQQILSLNQTKKGTDCYVNPFKSKDAIYIDAKK